MAHLDWNHMQHQRDGEYCVVIGGTNVDIGGKVTGVLRMNESNPGTVKVGLGGVGRNIAQNLAQMGAHVHLVTVLGDDPHAANMKTSCRKLGIDLGDSLQLHGCSTGAYLYISDADGEMQLAVSDMSICGALTPDFLSTKLEMLQEAKAVVVDANIPEESIAWLAENLTVPIFADPVSIAKAGKLEKVLGKLYAVKPNIHEAELLSGVEISSPEGWNQACAALVQRGVKQAFISLGTGGVIAQDEQGAVQVPCLHYPPVNTTGCGDAAMAGIVWAYLQGGDLREEAEAALAAASIAAESDESVNPQMSQELLEERMRMIQNRQTP